jgi:hypothetical protein
MLSLYWYFRIARPVLRIQSLSRKEPQHFVEPEPQRVAALALAPSLMFNIERCFKLTLEEVRGTYVVQNEIEK